MLRISKFSHWRYCPVATFTLFLLGITLIALSSAQEPAPSGGKQYKELQPNMSLRNDSSAINDMLVDGIGGAEAKFDRYYKEYVFPEWTVAKNYPKLPSLRKTLARDFARARNAGAYQRLLQLSMDNLTPLATSPDYHPAVRFNATVMLGRLNSEFTPNRADPVAEPKVLPILLKLLNDESENDAAQFGALLGVARHAQFNTDEVSRPQIIDALLKQASTQEPPANRTSAGHVWFRATAIGGLGSAKGEEVKKAAPVLANIVNDSTEPDQLRRDAAAALGRLALTPDSGIDAEATARSLAKLAMDSVREEIETCQKDTTKTLNASALKNRLLPICRGLGGSEKSLSSQVALSAGTTNKDKIFIKNIWIPISKWYGKLDDRRLDTTNMNPNTTGGNPVTGSMPGMPGQLQTEARMATEEYMEIFKRELQEMENLLNKGS